MVCVAISDLQPATTSVRRLSTHHDRVILHAGECDRRGGLRAMLRQGQVLLFGRVLAEGGNVPLLVPRAGKVSDAFWVTKTTPKLAN